MGGFFKVFGGVIGSFALVGWLLSPFALYHFDRDAKATGILHCHFLRLCQWDWPESPAAKAALAISSLGQCRTNEATLQSAIASQNAAVAGLAAEGQRRTASASAAVQQAEKRAVGRNEEIAAIQNIKPLGPDLCSDALAVIHAVPQ